MFYERNYFIHYYDSDLKKCASISSLLKYFEDIAILHSEHVKLGIDYYTEHHVGWVLYKWDIKIKRFPEFKETIHVRTEPLYLKGFQAYRYFDILDLKGNEIVTANSMWLFLNTDTKKPTKITEDMFKGYGIDKNRMRELEFNEINNLAKIDARKEFDVRYIDIDTNHHVNNIKYVEWALEMVPVNIIEDYSMNQLKVNYQKEAVYGKSITSLIDIEKTRENIKCIHQISSQDTVLCVLETNWQVCR
jgi:medium-chain acyl-[acyl-carrier-protein] hydrolase